MKYIILKRFLSQNKIIPQIFDRHVKCRQKNWAARDPERSRTVDYLRDEVAERLTDRLLDIKRKFPRILDLGSGSGHVLKFMDKNLVDELVMLDSSDVALKRDVDMVDIPDIKVERVVGDEENLAFEHESFDAVLSGLSMHWINDLPELLIFTKGTFIQTKNILRPDGAFIGALFGSDTLFELRCSFQLADLERHGGISQHISPFAQASDIAGLLGRAGFNLTTIDIDEIIVHYPSPFELMHDLQDMAESNAVITRKPVLSRDSLIGMAAIYQELYGNAQDGTIPATFNIIYFIGWKPDPSQPKPLIRGSAQVSMKDINDSEINKN